MTAPRIAAVILAAGKGTRLKSELPKVLHEVCGRPMLAYVLDACRAAGVRHCLAVVGYGKDRVIEAFADDGEITWVEQSPQLGTGHAVMVCGEQLAGLSGPVLVVAGDGPLIRAATLRKLLKVHAARRAACTLATSIMPEPGKYGRIVRDERGELAGIVEYLDADERQRAVREVNVSLYCFDAAALRWVVGRLRNDNAKGEYYLTDALGLLRSGGHKLAAVPAVPPREVLSINDRVQLAEVNELFQRRVQERWMLSGVTIEQPSSTWIDPRAQLGPDTVIRPNTVLDGPCRVGRGCVIGPFVHLRGTRVADRSAVEHTHG
jgi:bifunctional UDP-N-acetylglucosamine pyrophosphorylase/glucosamine-1-phosphate N-acetyltransferase